MIFFYTMYAWLIGGLSFVIILLISILLTYILPGRKYFKPVQWMFRAWFRLLFIRVRIIGKPDIPADRRVIFMANHSGIFDLPLMAAYMPVFFRGIESHNQFSWPLWGWAIRRFGSIPINRNSVAQSMATIRYAQAELAKGTPLAILPEGHMSRDGSLKEFKRLPFLLAKESASAIIPIGISGVHRIKPKGKQWIRPVRIILSFGPTIPSELVRTSGVDNLLNLVKEEISKRMEPVH